MISKNKKRKILIPKSANLRKCSIQLGQIDNIVTRMNSAKRKTYGTSNKVNRSVGTPAATKVSRMKNDMSKNKTSTPLFATNERISKRTPKPNRRYVNDETINSSSWNEKEEQSEADEDEDNDDEMEEEDQKSRNRIPAPKSVAAALNKAAEKLALSKRKIVYDERPGPKSKKVSNGDFFFVFLLSFLLGEI